MPASPGLRKKRLMNLIKRPAGAKLAQDYFYNLIRDASASPPVGLDPATARLVRALFEAEQTASQPNGADFEAVRQRIRQRVRPPVQPTARKGTAAATPAHFPHTGTAFNEAEPAFYPPRPGGWAWDKFVVLAGMAATIVLVVGLLALSLAGLRLPGDGSTGGGATPASVPPLTTASIQPITTAPPPVKTLQPTLRPNPKTGVDWQNPKSMLEPALPVTAKRLSLDSNELLKRLQGGQSLAEIAKMQGVDLQQVKDALLGSFKTQLDAAVQSGQITQPEADQAYQAAIPFVDSYVVSAVEVSPKLTPTP